MNEGTATYVHYRIMTRLHEQGRLSDGNFLEFLQSHTNVVFQPDFDDPRFSGFNPYALGFAMMQDIERIVTDPDDEDRAWFPESAGIKVDAIHDERGYRRVRRELARQFDVGFIDPNIEVVDVDLAGDRQL